MAKRSFAPNGLSAIARRSRGVAISSSMSGGNGVAGSISMPTAFRSRRSPIAATAIRLSCAIEPTTPAGQIGAPNVLLRIGRPAKPIEFISSRATRRAAPLARRLSIAGKDNDALAVPGLLIGHRVISQGDELALLHEEMASSSPCEI